MFGPTSRQPKKNEKWKKKVNSEITRKKQSNGFPRINLKTCCAAFSPEAFLATLNASSHILADL